MANPIIYLNNNPTINSLAPDGTVIHSDASTSTFLINAIGERKHLELDITFDTGYENNGVQGFTVYYCPAMDVAPGVIFPTINSKPLHGYKYSFVSPPVPGTTYQMAPFSAVIGAENLLMNYVVELECVSAGVFIMHHYYYEIYDVDNFMNPKYENNHSKLLKEKKLSTYELTVQGPSKYTENKRNISLYLFIENIADNTSKGYAIKELWYIAGFYNQSPVNAVGYFTTPLFELSRNSSVVTSLSVNEDTKIKFQVECPHSLLDNVTLWLIRTDTTDQTVNYLDNYEYSLIECITTGGSSTIDNKLKAPCTGITGAGTTKYVDVMVDHTKLTFGAKYRFIAVCYKTTVTGPSGGYKVTSFISDEITADAYPSYQGGGIDFKCSLSDYRGEYYGNNLRCCIEERIMSKIVLTYGGDKWKNDIFNRLGLVVTNDIRRYLTNIDVEILDETTDALLGLVTNIYDRKNAVKVNATTYTTPSGMNLSFGTDTATFKYTWRNRYESGTANLETQVNGVVQTPPFTTQDWGGKTLTIRWKLKFTYDDFATPFTDTLILNQKISVNDYDDRELSISSDKTTYCVGDEMCMAANLLLRPNPTDYKLITMIEVAPGNSSTIEENDLWADDELAQLTTVKIIDQEEDFGSDKKADFCVDTNECVPGLTYKVSVLAKYKHVQYD